MASSESRPLLGASYDATTSPPRRRASLKPAGGRGKERFGMRQRMRKAHASQSAKSVFGAVFASQAMRVAGKAGSSQGGSPRKQGSYKSPGSGKPRSLSIDRQESAEGQKTPAGNGHSALYNALNPKSRSPSARTFQRVATVVILIDAIIYILSTEEDLAHHSRFFYLTEGITSTLFAIEYFARLYVCTEKRSYQKYGPFYGRLRYMRSWHALIDAFATFPFFIELLSGIPLPTLTYLRVFRVLRITRTQSYSKSMDAVGRVLYFNREILYVAAVLGMYLVVVTSILMYYLRPRGKDVEYVDDPGDFDSIASTMVLSTLMLTGQGGPSGNLPWYTQCVVLLTGVFSVAMFAIPASMLTWGFEAEAERLGAKAKKKAMARKRGEAYESDTSSSSSDSSCVSGYGDISTSDEEYLNVIGGDDDDEGDGGKSSSNILQNASSMGQDQLQSLVGRIEMLEQKVASTNDKLDRILQKLEGR